MRLPRNSKFTAGLVVLAVLTAIRTQAFEGHISAIISRGGPPDRLLYTVGTNYVRIEMTDTNRPNAVDILDRNSGTVTLLFSQNHCFMQLKAVSENTSVGPSNAPPISAVPPPGIGPRPHPGNALGGAPGIPNQPRWPVPPEGMPPGIGPTNFPGMPGSQPTYPMPVMRKRHVEHLLDRATVVES